MNSLQAGLTTTAILFAISLLAHEPWRWVGLFLGRNLDLQSEVFGWVRAVTTSLVAALVMRLVLFPAGALEGVPQSVRVGAMAAGLAVFFVSRRSMAAGVLVAAIVLAAGQLAIG